MYSKIGNYSVRFSTSALCSWLRRPKLYRYESYVHFVYGRFSLIIENETIPIFRICAECYSAEEIRSVSCHTEACESWDVCQNCGTIEGRTRYINQREMDRLERGTQVINTNGR